MACDPTTQSGPQTPLVLDIKYNALDDGPGIRSVLFFKGCLLSCDWCHNPESISRKPEISYDAAACIGWDDCGARCNTACPSQAIVIDNQQRINRVDCSLCYQCVDACPSEAISRVGDPWSVDEVYKKLMKYKPFYDTSGGGVTLSGGEPTLHMEYISQLLQKLKAAGVHTLLQTCGLFPFDKFMQQVFPWLDTIYFDLKIFDNKKHRQYCGTNNDIILSNFKKLHQHHQQGEIELLARTPLVPGITDDTDNLQAISLFLDDCNAQQRELVKYNPIWKDKRAKLGYEAATELAPELTSWMSDERYQECEKIYSGANNK